MWNSTRKPEAYGWMGYLEGEGLFVKMVCEEKEPKRVYQNHQDPDYKDSAMEVFLAFPEEGEELSNDCMYTNFEINSNGAMLANYGKGRKNGQPFYCNFYKIAEDEAIVHYGSYSLIENETPNFHLPVCFAEARIES